MTTKKEFLAKYITGELAKSDPIPHGLDTMESILELDDGIFAEGEKRYRVYTDDHDAAVAVSYVENVHHLPREFLYKYLGEKTREFDDKIFPWAGDLHSFVLGMIYQKFSTEEELDRFLAEAVKTYGFSYFMGRLVDTIEIDGETGYIYELKNKGDKK